MGRYEKIKKAMLELLNTRLSKNLYYHGLHHVLDVLAAAEMLGEKENIAPAEMELLRVAVLFHDSGHIIDTRNHEKLGCDMAKDKLPDFGYSDAEIETICGMILATRYPQSPNNLLEQIICDADLDYLGRDDYPEISNTLYQELSQQGRLSNQTEWTRLQLSFLSSHKYFTKTANELRTAKKEARLQKIKEEINLN